jgi:hypothetical protein
MACTAALQVAAAKKRVLLTRSICWLRSHVKRSAKFHAYFGAGFHHPHLRGATVGDWPLNAFRVQDGTDQRPILRAIATSDLHNLVFQSDYRIIPAVTRPYRAGS